MSCLLCNLSSKNQIRKLGDTKYQTGKYQIGKYLASFAWTSVAQLAEVSKPGIAREREREMARATFPQLGICLRALGRALKPRTELGDLVGFVGDRQVAPRQTHSGGQRHQGRNMGSRQRGRFMKCKRKIKLFWRAPLLSLL